MAIVQVDRTVDDRFDGISRGAQDAAEALDPGEQALLESGVSAPELGIDDDPAFHHTAADAMAPNQQMLPAQLRRPKPAPVPDAVDDARIPGPAPKPEPPPLVADAPAPSPALAPQAEELNRQAAEQWQQLNTRPDFQTQADIWLAEERQKDPEPPAYEVTDHIEWQAREHRRELHAVRAANRLEQTHDRIMQTLSLVNHQERAWSSANPDYFDRVNFLRDRRDRELQLMGYADPAQRAQMVAQEAAMLVSGAVRQGRNPAAVVHEMSNLWGFKGAGGAPAGNGGRPATSPAAPAATRPSLATLADMDDEAFDRVVETSGGDLRNLLGR